MMIFAVFGTYSSLFIFSSFLRNKQQYTNFKPEVSIIVPCRNEEDVIEKTLTSIKNQSYENFEVIVVDDNSSDGTLEVVTKFIDSNGLENFRLLKRKENNSKKAKAVNEALKYSKGEIVVFFDADNSPQRECITNLVKRFSDDKIASVQGRIVTNMTNFISKIVFMERCSGFDVRFLGKEKLGMNCQFGGTAVAVRAKILKALGGFDEETLTEDTYLTSNLILQGYKIVYEPKAVVVEEAPPNITNYITQRTRWASGHMACFFEHAKKVFKAKISLRDKVDTLLFLAYYFVPILCGIAILLGTVSVLFNIKILNFQLYVLGIFLSLVPFLEIFVGVLRSKNKLSIYLLPALAFFFILNIVICFNAMFNILKGKNNWVKTERVTSNRKSSRDVQITMFSSVLVFFVLIGSFGSTAFTFQDIPAIENFHFKSDVTGGFLEEVSAATPTYSGDKIENVSKKPKKPSNLNNSKFVKAIKDYESSNGFDAHYHK
jgi:cellulose synthase/poly-beta-1,6-N-acetylglucosamine synthase-like glycosyltransferase